ncbi:hypothetical protein [Thiobacillus sp.]|uniref:hypothetical protein n=1 Tax=Thiobacillus sp. TaxID=924 RepID=UPI001ACAA3DE|nr:hypothetical protein [Thiobacillus sp.]MBN8779938.1 hypothetical protein [Thiobacillus sp.]
MDIASSAFDNARQPGESAACPLAFMPFRVHPAERLLLSLVVAGMSLPPPRFAAVTRLDAPSGALN